MTTSGLVTILFTDLVGSTDLGARIGDVAADELRRDHFSDLRGAIAETGGREVKTIGDAVMVTYPSAADALAGAVAMQRAVARRNRRSDGTALAMRVGISAGDATFEDDDWFGTPVVEASRLCATADGGQILASDLVRSLAGSRSGSELRPLEARQLKGLPEPIALCEVGWEEDMPAEVSAVPLPGFVETAPVFPFAGRVAEREVLLTAWKEAAEGDRRVVLVSGEPGVGKTRLVTELVRTADEQGALLLWGRCAEELDVPYQPFAEALRHYIHTAPTSVLRDQLGPLGGELSRLIPDLNHLVSGLPEPVSTEAETERHRLFEAVTDLIESMSRTTPIVFVLDDVHWADKPSLLLLRHVLRRPTPMPLLILATYRDTDLDRSHPLSDVLADLRREPGVERLDLQGLDVDDVVAFMESAAGHALEQSGLELSAAVHQETQGNPFFIGEMLLHLAESGLIVQREGRWTSDVTLAEVGIPEGIREVVGRRLSRLSDNANTALSIGAVIGPEFDVGLIEVLSGLSSDDVFDALDEATRAAIAREVTGCFGRYAFAHALVRSTLYEELSTNRRVRMHWQVAEAMEARHATDLEPHVDALAHHYSEGALAGDPLKAIEYGRRAAAKATADLAFEAAVRHLDRALSALELLTTSDLAMRFDLQLELGGALRATNDGRQREVGLAAADTAQKLDDPRRLATAVTAMTSVSGSSKAGNVDEEVVTLLETALDTLPDEASPLRARVLGALASELFWSPADKQRQHRLAGEAMAMARQTGDAEALQAILIRGWLLMDGSEPFIDTMTQYYAEAEAQDRDDPVDRLFLGRGRIVFAAAKGEGDLAMALANRYVEQSEALRQPRNIFWARADQAMMDAFLGDLATSEQRTIEAMTYGLEHGISQEGVMGTVGGIFYMLRQAQGRMDELIPALQDLVETQPGAPVWRIALCGALTESDRVPEAREQAEYLSANRCANVPPDVEYPVTMCGLARLTITVPLERESMQHIYEHLLPFAGTYNWSGTTVTDANDHGLAVVAARLGEIATSEAHFAAALALGERSGARPYLASCHCDWARLLAERGEPVAAGEHARRALAISEEIGGVGPTGVATRARAVLESLV